MAIHDASAPQAESTSELSLLRAFEQLSSDLVLEMVVDKDGLPQGRWAGGAYQMITGYSPLDVHELGEHAFPVYGEDRDQYLEMLKTLTPGEDHTFEIRLQRKNGRIRRVASLLRPRFENGHLKSLFLVARNAEPTPPAEPVSDPMKERLQALFDHALIGIAVTDLEFNLTELNPTFADLFGYPRDEMLGKTPLAMVHPDDHDLTRKGLVELVKGDTHSFVSTIRFVRRDGSIFWAEFNLTPLKDTEGRITSVQIVVFNITRRKVAEEELLASEKRYRELVERLPMPVAVLQDGRVVFMNQAGAELADVERPETLIGTTADRFVKGRARKRLHKLLLTALDPGRSPDPKKFQLEFSFQRPDASLVEVDSTMIPVTFEGKPAILMIARDISHRKEAERSLKEAAEHFRKLFSEAPDPIFLADPDRAVLIDANPAVSRLLHLTRDQIVGHHLTELFPEAGGEDVLERFQQHPDETEKPPPIETSILRTDGARIPIEINTRIIHRRGKTLIMGMIRDITARKQAEEAMLSASRLEATATLAGGLAHDINNLMASVMGNAQLLQLDLRNDETAMKKLTTIGRAAKRAGDLMKQLLAFAREGKYQSQIIDLNESIQDTLTYAKKSLPASLKIEQELDRTLWKVEADPPQMSQMLMNLLSNAADATGEEGSILIRTGNLALPKQGRKCGRDLPAGAYVQFEIIDNGSGMDEETIQRAFEPFFSTKFQGRGLGLAAVYGIVENHGGYIQINSRPGKGTAVCVFLPALEIRLTDTQDGIPHGSEPILVLDADEEVRRITEEILKRLGYEVIAARDAVIAAEMLAEFEQKVRLALIDADILIMGGVSVIDDLRREQPDMKVMMTSGFDIDESIQSMLEQGADGFLSKPFQLEGLATEVRKLLDQS
ncbi:PAS domain S-box protein [bacterium]|nr:PAS domain S-box protein [bacterium]